MSEVIKQVASSLQECASNIRSSYATNVNFNATWGWSLPSLTRDELADVPMLMAIRIQNVELHGIADDYDEILKSIPEKLDNFKTATLPYLFNGNGASAISSFTSLMQWIEFTLQPILNWQVADSKILPVKLVSRLRSINAEIDNLVPEKTKLEQQIRLIQEATSAAESLPTDLQSLKEARNNISNLSTDAAKLYGSITTHSNDSEMLSKQLKEREEEANKLVAQCYEAYRITTSTGLAGAFDDRAKRLSYSMWFWVAGLLLALAIGAILGANRYESLSKVLDATKPSWGVIWVHIALSIFSVAAPVWFAWISTKQIGQRFRLSEDYAFKASVAKAYEGYRREAARIDPAFEARLFGSALTRLEEAPLRLVEQETHGSPWQELVSSDGFQKALQAFPELREKFMSMPREIISTVTNGIKTNVAPNELAAITKESVKEE